MCSIVSGDGFPLNSAIVTFLFPIATPFSNSNSFRKPRARSNHFALSFGSRTARPKWPTSPSVNGTFIWIGGLIVLGTVSRNEPFHEVPVEIFQCVAGCWSETARAGPQLRSNRGQPGTADHSHPRPQPCCGTSRIVLEEGLDVGLYHRG